MYGKIFATLWNGSMVGSGAVTQLTFIWMIANANAKGLVEVNPKVLAFQFGDVKEADVRRALDFLSEVDEESRTPDFDGRRVEYVEGFTWRVLNYSYYRRLRSEEERREYKRKWIAEKRAAEIPDDAVEKAFDEIWVQVRDWSKLDPPYMTRPQRKPCFEKFERYVEKVQSVETASEYFKNGLSLYAASLGKERKLGHKDRAAKNSKTIFNEIYRGEWEGSLDVEQTASN